MLAIKLYNVYQYCMWKTVLWTTSGSPGFIITYAKCDATISTLGNSGNIIILWTQRSFTIPEDSQAGEVPSYSAFCSIQCSTDGIRHTHIREDKNFHCDSNISLIQKHTNRHTQNNVWTNVLVPHGPVRLTHHINHYNTTS